MQQTPLNWALTLALIAAAMGYQALVVLPMGLPADLLISNSIIMIGCTVLALTGSPFRAGPYQSVMAFFAIFFGIVPPLHFSQEVLFWGADNAVLSYYAPAMILALISIAGFHVSYRLAARISVHLDRPTLRSAQRISPSRLLAVSLLATLAVYAMNKFSVGSVLIRGGQSKSLLPIGQTNHLIYQFVIFPMPSVAFILYAVQTKKPDRWWVILAVLMLAANPPTGMARFQAAALYIAAALAAFPFLLRMRPVIPIGLLFGMLLIFPTLELFRYFGAANQAAFSTNFLFQGHFDSFQSLAAALENGAITWGYALLGVALFFVPRALWPEKPIGSGSALAEQEGYYFSNISMNLIGEGYTNFGIAGAIAFMVAAGALLGKLDRHFWLVSPNKPVFRTQYLLSIGLVFFIMRGDLLSSVAFTVGIMISAWLVNAVSLAVHKGHRRANGAIKPTERPSA